MAGFEWMRSLVGHPNGNKIPPKCFGPSFYLSKALPVFQERGVDWVGVGLVD